MKTQMKKTFFVKRIQNRQFRALFFKNWLIVFLSIVIPLLLSVSFVRVFSERTLLNEVDSAVRRATNNTAVTVDTLLDEACRALEKESLDESINSFFQMKYSLPVKYEFIYSVRSVLDRISDDYRENLYDSMDVYSATGNYIVSSPYNGQELSRVEDLTLLEVFETALAKDPNQVWIAEPHLTQQDYLGGQKRVISLYRVRTVNDGKKSFVSISIDTEKMIGYLTDNLDSTEGAFLIVDKNNQVVMDTSGLLDGQILHDLIEPMDTVVETDINGERVWAFSVPLNYFQWKFVQIIPMDEVQENNQKLSKIVLMVVALGMGIAAVLSYCVTVKLYYPIEAILQLLENPTEQMEMDDQQGEVQYLLVSILELFQKNMTLEQEMVSRVVALRRVRAKALQEQMTPHFLNNVLQTINWTAIMEIGKDDSLTSRSLLLLADIIRTSKEKTTNLTTVVEEIEYTKKFVELERLRFGENIHCFFNITEKAKQMPIPCVSLQTLVENSISHGLQPKNGSGNIYVSICDTDNKGLSICVEDDGIGIKEEKIHQIFSVLEKEFIYAGEHVGIVNLFQRFRLIYGNDCEFEIANVSQGGTRVEIKLPELPDWWNIH